MSKSFPPLNYPQWILLFVAKLPDPFCQVTLSMVQGLNIQCRVLWLKVSLRIEPIFSYVLPNDL